ncbi:hypothetical protein NHH03_16565 [Stieleria sp. TO1_6]|uniref:hypothetical protein n=1 Tax=Stieleria tagensis TaxID=2956795 RepID=UPI00209B3988|nr:hypothetical protein [Stieleria tagensis]MCO8123365.1 hypothetical protein [Stieleria tagensis]
MLQTALQGEVVSQVFEGQRRFDLFVRLEEEHRTDYANLGRLRIDLPHQAEVNDHSVAGHGHRAGPHDGTIADWGGGKYHVEFTVDHGKTQATAYA